jgi:hypothetical protein
MIVAETTACRFLLMNSFKTAMMMLSPPELMLGSNAEGARPLRLPAWQHGRLYISEHICAHKRGLI